MSSLGPALYVGDLSYGSTALHRLVALRKFVPDIEEISTCSSRPMSKLRSIVSRTRWKLGFPCDDANINAQIEAASHRKQFRLLWIDKSLALRASTLRAFRAAQPSCFIAYYSPDDMKNPANQNRSFHKSLPLLNVFFTTKIYQVAELESWGVPRAIFVDEGFDPETHRPVDLTAEEYDRWRAEIGFIGSYEADRAWQMQYLIDSGLDVRVLGSGWEKARSQSPALVGKKADVRGVDYAKAIQATQINLCFLRRANRDQQTTRSIEIPACGGFMLAERTPAHQRLFKEGEEAEFFSSVKELLEKVRYYLLRPSRCKEIGRAGRARCVRSGYSNIDRMQFMVACLDHNA